MQPFSSQLFGMGSVPGPTILMKLLRGEITKDDVEAEFERMEEERRSSGVQREAMRQFFECHDCTLSGKGDDAFKPVDEFGCRKSSELIYKVLSKGCWRRCTECSKAAKGLAGAAPGGAAAGAAHSSSRMERMRHDGELVLTCKICKQDKEHHLFPKEVLHNRKNRKLRCTACHQVKCPQCKIHKDFRQFHFNRQTDTYATLCLECDLYQCHGPCGKLLKRNMFSTDSFKNLKKRNTPLRCQQCNSKQ